MDRTWTFYETKIASYGVKCTAPGKGICNWVPKLILNHVAVLWLALAQWAMHQVKSKCSNVAFTNSFRKHPQNQQLFYPYLYPFILFVFKLSSHAKSNKLDLISYLFLSATFFLFGGFVYATMAFPPTLLTMKNRCTWYPKVASTILIAMFLKQRPNPSTWCELNLWVILYVCNYRELVTLCMLHFSFHWRWGAIYCQCRQRSNTLTSELFIHRLFFCHLIFKFKSI